MSPSWKLQNQVLCLLLFSSIFVMTCMMTVSIIAYQQIEQIYTNESQFVVVKENNRSSTRLQYVTIRNIRLILNRSLRQLVNNNYVYQYSQALNYQYIQPPKACMNNCSEVDTYSFNSSVCYGFYGNQTIEISEQDEKLLNFTALMSMTLLIQDTDSFFYASTQKNKFLARYQGQYLLGFDPQTRPWYLTFMNYKGCQLTTFTTPYYSLSNQNYLISQSTALRNLDGGFAGVMAGQLILSDLLQSQQLNMNITIFDESGLIYNVGQQNSSQIYLYNESYTGFNEQQSVTILNSLTSTEPFLLYNSLYQQDLQVNAKKLYNTGLYLLFQTNPSYQNYVVEILFSIIQLSLIKLYIKTTVLFTVLVLCLIGISILILIILFRPIQQLELLMQNYCHSDKVKIQKQVEQFKKSNKSQLQILQASFQKMIENITNCKRVNQESIQLNKQSVYAQTTEQDHLSQCLLTYLKGIQISRLPPKVLKYKELLREEFLRYLLSIR